MKKGWSLVPLVDVLEQDRQYVTELEPRSYKKLSVKLYGRGVTLDTPANGADVKMEKHQFAKSGQVIVSEIWAKKGAIGVVPTDGDGALITSHFFLFDIKSAGVLPGWIHWILKGNYLERQLSAGAFGTTGYASVRPATFLAARIPLPPLAEQRRIVSHLDAIESRLAQAQKLREDQEKQIKAVLTAAFHKLQSDVTLKPLAEVAPLAWRQIAIDPDESYTEFGVRSFYKGIFLRRKVPGSTFSWQELYRLRAGDVVFSNIMAWEKAIAMAGPEHDGWVGNHRMLVCEPKPEIVLPSYLLHYFMTAEGFAKILQASPGTAARNKTLKADNLMAIQVPIPALSRQRTFNSLCDHVTRIRAAQIPQVAQASKTLPSLLDRIFNS